MSHHTTRTTLELYGLNERGEPIRPQADPSASWSGFQHDDLVFPLTLAFMLSAGVLPLLSVIGW